MKIVVVGAGIAGLSVGWRLAQAGASVTILERAQPARGATWAAAGMLAPLAEALDTNPDEAKLSATSADAWPSFAAGVQEASGRDIHYRCDGSLVAALNDAELAALQRRADASLGGARMMSASDAKAVAPLLNPDTAGALFNSADAQVDNRRLGNALARAFVRAGGNLSSSEAAVKIECDGDVAIGVRTPFAMHHAEAVLLAAGAWTGEIEMPPQALPPVVPVKGELLSLIPPEPASIPTPLVWGNGVYLVPRGDRLHVGATSERVGIDTRVTEGARVSLLESARGLMPSLADWDVEDQWAGLRPGSPDDLPILGETAVKALFVATGQYRNGILFAPVIADAMSRLILSGEVAEDIRAFDPKRFAR
jgi:glycine oxidase